MQTLTDRQQETLDWIKAYLGENGIPPTRSELAEGLGLRDASSVSGHLASLADQGWIELRPKIQARDPVARAGQSSGGGASGGGGRRNPDPG